MAKKSSVPSKMTAVVLTAYGRPNQFSIRETPTPKPTGDEVLIRIGAAPINPSDLAFIDGLNPTKRKLPSTPGFEGAGLVVATGNHPAAKKLLGKRVACRASSTAGGTWAEYAVTNSDRCIPVPSDFTWGEASTLLINPLTAWMLFFSARKQHKAAIHTAATSALGKMIIRLSKEFSFPVINIVRSEQSVESLRKLGAKWVLDSSKADFPETLSALAKKLEATVAFEAVSGPLAATVLKAMPAKSQLWMYGVLSGQPCEVDPMILIYQEKSIRGFWGPPEAYGLGPREFGKVVKGIAKRKSTTFQTEIQAQYPFREIEKALPTYREKMSGGKILLVPDQEP